MTITPRHSLRTSRLRAGLLACGLIGSAVCAFAQSNPWLEPSSSMDTFAGNPDSHKFIWIPADTDDWTRHFHIGAVVGFNIHASFNESGLFSISGSDPANGIFDDGYVHPDQSGDPTYTSYFGFNNYSSQYNAANQTLTMHGSTSFAATGSSQHDGGPFPGFDMVYGDNLWYWKHARVGWELGFGLLPITIKDTSPLSAMVNQSIYTFDTTGAVLLHNAQGGYNAGSSGQGPFINETPAVSSSQSVSGTVTGSRTLDVMLYTIKFGPSFYWDITEKFGMSLGAGPALGLVTGDYKYDETITTTANGVSSHSSGKYGTTDFVYGGYVNGTVLWHVLNNADIYLGAQYMPLSSADFSNGGRAAKLDLSGQVYISAGISWPF